MSINIGDRVRFLHEVGGGVVKGFKDKNTVMVEGDDGFDLPMLITECVVVGNTDALNFERKPTLAKPASAPSQPEETKVLAASSRLVGESNAKRENVGVSTSSSLGEGRGETPTIVQEFAGHEALNVHLAFLPVDIKTISTSLMEAWLVNDSNYFITYAWASIGSGSLTLFEQGTLEPNSVVFLREFTRDMYEQLEHVSFQLFAYKQNKPYMRKPVIDVEMRIDKVKFFKMHTFTDTPFFDEPALLYDIVRGDAPVRPVIRPTSDDAPSVGDLRSALNGERHRGRDERRGGRSPRPTFGQGSGAPLEVDLHIGELLETTAGMSNADILEHQLDVFRKTLDANRGQRGRRIVFIHGKGDGVLRAALKKELERRTHDFSFQDASFQRYGFGAMLVIVK